MSLWNHVRIIKKTQPLIQWVAESSGQSVKLTPPYNAEVKNVRLASVST
jgi:hypothetical protein